MTGTNPGSARSIRMQKVHPYAQAEYKVFEQPDRSFGVTIVTPETSPANVT